MTENNLYFSNSLVTCFSLASEGLLCEIWKMNKKKHYFLMGAVGSHMGTGESK